MGETMLRFGIDEIAAYRVTCTKIGKGSPATPCGFVVEIPLSKAAAALNGTLTCPACHNHLWEQGSSGNALHDFQDAARRIREFGGLSLEFVVSKAAVE